MGSDFPAQASSPFQFHPHRGFGRLRRCLRNPGPHRVSACPGRPAHPPGQAGSETQIACFEEAHRAPREPPAGPPTAIYHILLGQALSSRT